MRRVFHHKGETAYQKKRGYVVPPYITPIYSSVKLPRDRELFLLVRVRATHKPLFQVNINSK